MARQRPTASDVTKPVPARIDRSARSPYGQFSYIDGDDAPDDDVAAIIIRAGELGFAPSRVATALGVSPDGVAAIQQAMGTSTRTHAHAEQPRATAPAWKHYAS